MKEREPVGIFVSLESGLMHQAADGEVGHHEAIKLLTHQIGGFAAQHDLGSAEVGLEFIEQQGDILPINIIVPMKSLFTILFTRCARTGYR